METLRNIMNTVSSQMNTLTSLAANDGKVSEQFSDAQMSMAAGFKNSLDDFIDDVDNQKLAGKVFLVLGAVFGALSSAGAGAGLAANNQVAQAIGRQAGKVGVFSQNVIVPIVGAAGSAVQGVFGVKQGQDVKEQSEYSAASKLVGDDAKGGIDAAGDVMTQRSAVTSDVRSAIGNENQASNY